eukprot:12255.XXX_265996_265161_1 [CDS] Oithona nana genome sequencing.
MSETNFQELGQFDFPDDVDGQLACFSSSTHPILLYQRVITCRAKPRTCSSKLFPRWKKAEIQMREKSLNCNSLALVLALTTLTSKALPSLHTPYFLYKSLPRQRFVIW